jgi:riboflavin biosynthesis pyrimidine reductase
MRVLLDELTGSTLGVDQRELGDDELAALYAAPRVPWLRVNFVGTLDGAATGESGRSGSINNAADKRVFHLLRGMADAIVVGAGTARTEGYRPAHTPIVVVSRRGEVPPLLREAPPGAVLLATCASAEGLAEARATLPARDVLVLGQDTVDLAALREELVGRGHLNLLSEGGPHLFGDLLAAGVVDELCLTTVPQLIAGGHPRITAGGPVAVPLRPQVLLEEDGSLLGRWFVR